MDEKTLLAAIGQMIDEKLGKQKTQIIAETTHNMNVLFDTEVKKRFDLLAEGQSLIVERLDRLEDKMEIMDTKDGAHEIKLRVID